MYPLSRVTVGDYPEVYVGFNAGAFSFKQWYSTDFVRIGGNAPNTREANYTQPIGDDFSLAFHAGYAWGDYWEASREVIDYAVQANYSAGNFTIFGKFTAPMPAMNRSRPMTSATTSRAS